MDRVFCLIEFYTGEITYCYEVQVGNHYYFITVDRHLLNKTDRFYNNDTKELVKKVTDEDIALNQYIYSKVIASEKPDWLPGKVIDRGWRLAVDYAKKENLSYYKLEEKQQIDLTRNSFYDGYRTAIELMEYSKENMLDFGRWLNKLHIDNKIKYEIEELLEMWNNQRVEVIYYIDVKRLGIYNV